MPDYRERVGELITPAFRADFEQQVGTAELTVAQAELGRSCEVYGAGVSGMDADSATALVAGEVHLPFAQRRDIVLAPDYAAHAPAED